MGEPGKQRRWRRLNWLCRWGGLAVCVVVAGVWPASRWWCLAWFPRQTFAMNVGAGSVGVYWADYAVEGDLNGTVPPARDLFTLTHLPHPRTRFDLVVEPMWRWRARFFLHRPDRGFVEMPLGYLLAVAAAPTALAWRSELRRRRRERLGMCAKCGYDLAGFVAGVACPECGTARGEIQAGE